MAADTSGEVLARAQGRRQPESGPLPQSSAEHLAAAAAMHDYKSAAEAHLQQGGAGGGGGGGAAAAPGGLDKDAADRGGSGGGSGGSLAAAAAAGMAPSNSSSKIRCLDGLRGIACVLVFNYHFLWPWTPAIMLGYGAWPPGNPQPYWSPLSLPILCLLNRGRPMVAVFFAISGYVLCRHVLRAIRERRLDAAYRGLASAVFRRVFRLYLPPTISMLLVAVLAQVGVFRSEFSVYKGPDSAYINGTVTNAAMVNATAVRLGAGKVKPCLNGTHAVLGVQGFMDEIGVPTTDYMGNLTDFTGKLCLNRTSMMASPASVYTVIGAMEGLIPNRTANTTILSDPPTHQQLNHYMNITNTTWYQLGGSWEEHPFIHDNVTYAVKNFTRSYAEWANPFNFGHYHPRYDPHTFTIPMELRGSMFIYLFLLGTAALQARWRLGLGGFLSAYSLFIGRWDMSLFLGGALHAELDLRRGFDPSTGPRSGPRPPVLAPPATAPYRRRRGPGGDGEMSRPTRWALTVVALYFLSYPDVAAEYTPGFWLLSLFVPKYYFPMSGWMFYQALGALILLPCVLRSPTLRRLLESPVAQYFGKVSFSLYLVHGPVLHSLGFWVMPRLFDAFGKTGGLVVGWPLLFGASLYLTNVFHQKVDVWSTTVGRRVERHMLE